MPYKFYERPKSGSSTVNPPTYTSQWVSQGSSDRAYVQAQAIANTPAVVTTPAGTLYRQDARIEPASADVFYVTVPYAQFKHVTGEYRLSFDTPGGMIHISNSLESIRRYSATNSELGSDPPAPAPAGIPSHNGAIGVHGKEIDGFDKFIPALKITATFRHPAAIITLPHIKTLSRATGTVNSDTFLTFNPGEVLFLGCSGSEGTDTETTVSYTFAMSENRIGLTIGDIAGVAKKGHEVLWIKYKDDVDDSKQPSRKPKYAYVERVYEEIPLALTLGFGA